MMYITRRAWTLIKLLALALVVSVSGSQAFAVDGPSFDCSHGVRQTLAVILCMNPEAAKADWDVNSAYWALFRDDREETTFNESVNRGCALPRLETPQEQAGRIFIQELGRRFGQLPIIPAPQPLTERHVQCVISAFHNRAAALRARLTDDALIESKLSPEEHKEIQTALAKKEFLQNRNRSYGASIDGQFGPNTRAAIKDFQRSINAQPNGFLSNEQRIALIESPEERDARAQRDAAQEKARQDAREAQRRAEEQAKQADLERNKKRLEEEAAKAAEWRRKIDEAKKKGPEYAKVADLKWFLSESMNPMTDEQDYSVSSTQTNGTGALAAIDGQCSKDQVVFEATLQDANDPKVPIGFASSSAGGIIGQKRINDDLVFATNFPLVKWRNQIEVSRLSFRDDDPESADTTWRVLAQIETSRGTLYIRIPMFAPKIQKLINACKQRYDVDKRRQGLPDTPG
jgi:peptidoglycan hydrolase-like protein with peptidoglycan-binding domain